MATGRTCGRSLCRRAGAGATARSAARASTLAFHIQKLHRRHDRLTEQVKELRARSLTVSSLRMISTRQSEIIRELELRGIPLEESLSPPKVIEK